MKKTKHIALLLSLTLCSSFMFGCSGSDNSSTGSTAASTTAGSTAVSSTGSESRADAQSEEPTTLSIWVPDNIRIEDWETNAMTLWLEEQGNFNLEFTPLSANDYVTKVNVSLTTGSVEELPDVIVTTYGTAMEFTDSMVWSWAQAETILPLTDYYNNPELAVHINKAIERTGVDYTQQIVAPDGNIYGFATYNQSYGSEFPGKLWIYKPWLEALGKDAPTTTDEFYELLKLVSQTDLNGNGTADEIGMLGSRNKYNRYFQVLMNPFVYAGDVQYRTVENGTVSVAYNTEEWKQGLHYISKLFSEGLILPESLTMSDEQFQALINSEEPVVFSFSYSAPDAITSGSQRSAEYICIDTLTGPNGVNYSTYRPSSTTISFIVTSNCKNPEAAFRLGDLISSEYSGICQRWGEEGVDWDYAENAADASSYKASVEGFDLSIIAYDDTNFWGGTDVTNGSWRQIGPYVRQYGIANGVGVSVDKSDEYTKNVNAAFSLYQNSDHEPAEVIPKLVYTDDEARTIAEIESTLKAYVDESVGNFVTGNKDIDAEWDNYLKNLEGIGLNTYLETIQPVYDRMYK